MRKRIDALFLAITVLLLSGCGRLTPEGYRDALKDQWKSYLSAQMAIVNDIVTLDESGALPAEFDEHCESFEKAMDGYEKIKPPSDIQYKHNLLLESLENERGWLAAVRELTSAKTPEEIEQAENKIQAAANYKNSFPEQYIKLISELPRNDSCFIID